MKEIADELAKKLKHNQKVLEHLIRCIERRQHLNAEFAKFYEQQKIIKILKR